MEVRKNQKMVTNLDKILVFVHEYNWEIIALQNNIGMLSLSKTIDMKKDKKTIPVKVRVNIYLTTLSIATSMNHPTKGKTQLYRKKQHINSIGKILENPRIHTGKGYYKK